MTLKQKIADNYCVLLRSVDPSVDLLGSLRPVPFVEDRIAFIEEHDTDHQKNNALLKTLLEVPDNRHDTVMHGYILALRSNGQDHVANIFHRENDKVIMSGEHHKLLSKKRHNLCEFMNPRDGLLGHLISEEIFSETDSERILSKAGLNEMAMETVNILMRKSDCAFDKFVNALNATNQSHVSCILTDVGDPPMSDEHRKLLSDKMNDLENFLDTENDLLSSMINREVISDDEDERIRSLKGMNAMARELVKILRRKSDGAFQQFITSLSEARQSHVAYILTGEGDSRPLKEEHRRRLLSGPRRNLVNTIDSKSKDLIPFLMDQKYAVFSKCDMDRVNGVRPNTHNDRNEMILDLIARKSQQDFFNFISALNDTDQTHVVVELIGIKIVAKIKTEYESGIPVDVSQICDVDVELLKYMREMFERNGIVVSRLNKILSEEGIAVLDVNRGCIEITFTCKCIESLHQLKQLIDSQELERMINEAFCSQFAEKGLKSLKVEITDDQFEQCEQTFARCIPMTPEHREALLSSVEFLVENMVVSSDLLKKLSLSERRIAIESAASSEEQVKTLIDIVSRQPDSAFAELFNAVNDTQQTEAATIIGFGMRREDSTLQTTQARDAWKEVDNYLQRLRFSITSCGSYEGSTFGMISPALHGFLMAVHRLREQYTVLRSRPTTEETIAGELEHQHRWFSSPYSGELFLFHLLYHRRRLFSSNYR